MIPPLLSSTYWSTRNTRRRLIAEAAAAGAVALAVGAALWLFLFIFW